MRILKLPCTHRISHAKLLVGCIETHKIFCWRNFSQITTFPLYKGPCIPFNYYNIDAHSRLLMPLFISAGSHRPNPLNVKFLAWQLRDLAFCWWNSSVGGIGRTNRFTGPTRRTWSNRSTGPTRRTRYNRSTGPTRCTRSNRYTGPNKAYLVQ